MNKGECAAISAIHLALQILHSGTQCAAKNPQSRRCAYIVSGRRIHGCRCTGPQSECGAPNISRHHTINSTVLLLRSRISRCRFAAISKSACQGSPHLRHALFTVFLPSHCTRRQMTEPRQICPIYQSMSQTIATVTVQFLFHSRFGRLACTRINFCLYWWPLASMHERQHAPRLPAGELEA